MVVAGSVLMEIVVVVGVKLSFVVMIQVKRIRQLCSNILVVVDHEGKYKTSRKRSEEFRV